jgi:hypothetical protein
MDWIGLAEDRGQVKASVNAVMNLEFHRMLGSSGVAAQILASAVVLSFIELFSYLASYYSIYMELLN